MPVGCAGCFWDVVQFHKGVFGLAALTEDDRLQNLSGIVIAFEGKRLGDQRLGFAVLGFVAEKRLGQKREVDRILSQGSGFAQGIDRFFDIILG